MSDVRDSPHADPAGDRRVARPIGGSRQASARTLKTPGRGEPYWPAQLCAGCILLLYLALPERLTFGSTWIVPLLAGSLLAGLALTTPRRTHDEGPVLRRAAIGLVSLVSFANAASLALLVHFLFSGGRTTATTLIVGGAVIWLTNVAVFALWFWELDAGGPGVRSGPAPARPEFLFPQHTSPAMAPAGWRPAFVDYLYLSFTNATAFSPTDTMPLTPRAKLLMLIQALASLVTVGLVVARAVNIVG